MTTLSALLKQPVLSCFSQTQRETQTHQLPEMPSCLFLILCSPNSQEHISHSINEHQWSLHEMAARVD